MERITSLCVSSEDIKHDLGADTLFGYMQIGFGVYARRKEKDIALVGYTAQYLGDDLKIKEIRVFGDKKKSVRLTEKYKNKILISSLEKDDVN